MTRWRISWGDEGCPWAWARVCTWIFSSCTTSGLISMSVFVSSVTALWGRLKYPVARVSTINVPIAAIIAPNPAKGKLCQGSGWRHEEVRLSKESGRMWMKAVARMTPAANDLMTKKASLSGSRAGIHFPRMGMQTPMLPQTRMENIATIFNGRAAFLSRASSSAEQSQSPWTTRGRRRRAARKNNKALLMMSELRGSLWNGVPRETKT